MRQHLVLASIFAIGGLILCTCYLVFLNVPIPFLPFTVWSQRPYAGMFQYAGIICIAAAIFFLLLEATEHLPFNVRSGVVMIAVVIANLTSLLIGGYHTLVPVFYLIGLLGTAAFSTWATSGLSVRAVVTWVGATTFIAVVDEYVHTAVGTLTYFDQLMPSPLTVFGWSLFLTPVLTVAIYVKSYRIIDLTDRPLFRVTPAILALLLVVIAAGVHGYFTEFAWGLALLYVGLGLTSLYYTRAHSFKWNLSLMALSLAFGFLMEALGQLEGLWTFRFGEPVSLLILFSWPLRTWTSLTLCERLHVPFHTMTSTSGMLISPEPATEKATPARAYMNQESDMQTSPTP